MRLNQKVLFVTESNEKFNPETGDYMESNTTYDIQWANVSDVGEERMNLVYGGIKQSAKTIRFNKDYAEPFDYIRIDGVDYKLMLSKLNRGHRVFEVVGV